MKGTIATTFTTSVHVFLHDGPTGLLRLVLPVPLILGAVPVETMMIPATTLVAVSHVVL